MTTETERIPQFCIQCHDIRVGNMEPRVIWHGNCERLSRRETIVNAIMKRDHDEWATAVKLKVNDL